MNNGHEDSKLTVLKDCQWIDSPPRNVNELTVPKDPQGQSMD